MSRSHFRHLPVSGDIGLVGTLDITDLSRALIDPRTSPSGPPPATPDRGSPTGTARGHISAQNRYSALTNHSIPAISNERVIGDLGGLR
jgi:hypothetical protein